MTILLMNCNNNYNSKIDDIRIYRLMIWVKSEFITTLDHRTSTRIDLLSNSNMWLKNILIINCNSKFDSAIVPNDKY